MKFDEIKDCCPSIKQGVYNSTIYLPSWYAHTFFNSLFPPRPKMAYETHIVKC